MNIPLSEKPFFIVGAPRSGTTLLRMILCSHPRLYIPSETGFLPFLNTPPDTMLSLAHVQQVLDRIGKLNRSWANIVSDPPDYYQSLPEPTLAHVIDKLYRMKIAPFGAVRWGDKTPLYIEYIPTIQAIFPDAQFIHLIRDGRDVALSSKKKWGNQIHIDLYYLLKNWARHMDLAHRIRTQIDQEHFLEVKYEDLVMQPQKTVEILCHFLGEDFNPMMLDHPQIAKEITGPRGHQEVLKPISTESVWRWEKELPPFERKLADRIAGPALARLGYKLAQDGPFTPIQSLHYFFLSVKYGGFQTLRRTLYRMGILTLNKHKRNTSKSAESMVERA